MILNDYDEKSVITPEIWFKTIASEEKLEQIRGIDKYILTFSYMKDLLEEIKEHNYKEIEWYPDVGIFEFEGIKIGVAISSVGAPATTALLEELIYLGGKYFILTGGVGVLNKNIERGDIIIPDGAIRDEGTSYHYLPPEVEVKPSSFLNDKLKNTCRDTGIKFYEGKVWTTDAVYRETPSRIKKFRKEGAVCVDMEASACFAVAMVRNVHLSSIFYAGDYLDEKIWDYRKKDVERSKNVQNILFHIISKTLRKIDYT